MGEKRSPAKLFALVNQDKLFTVGEFVDGVFSSAKKDKTRSCWEKPGRVKVPGGF